MLRAVVACAELYLSRCEVQIISWGLVLSRGAFRISANFQFRPLQHPNVEVQTSVENLPTVDLERSTNAAE